MVDVERTAEIAGLVGALEVHVDRTVARLEVLREFFEMSLPAVEDLDGINACLIQRGRPDLVIEHRADLPVMDDIRDAVSGPRTNKPGSFRLGNFPGSFEFYSVIGNDLGGPVPADFKPAPITEEELMGLVDGSFQFSRSYPQNHAETPAFLRMLTLFPAFSRDMVLDMSDPARRLEHGGDFAPEIFIAYSLMSRLVDMRDPYVMRDDQMDPLYLRH